MITSLADYQRAIQIATTAPDTLTAFDRTALAEYGRVTAAADAGTHQPPPTPPSSGKKASLASEALPRPTTPEAVSDRILKAFKEHLTTDDPAFIPETSELVTLAKRYPKLVSSGLVWPMLTVLRSMHAKNIQRSQQLAALESRIATLEWQLSVRDRGGV